MKLQCVSYLGRDRRGAVLKQYNISSVAQYNRADETALLRACAAGRVAADRLVGPRCGKQRVLGEFVQAPMRFCCRLCVR